MKNAENTNNIQNTEETRVDILTVEEENWAGIENEIASGFNEKDINALLSEVGEY